MSVIVDGVDMPKNCSACFMLGWCMAYLEPAEIIPAEIIPDMAAGRQKWCPLQETKPQIDADIYDKETTIHGCAVQILENTVTGKTSVGWWKEVNDA